MQLFIDSADSAEIKAGLEMGVVDGVTTNPSLLAKSGKPLKEAISEIIALKPGPISLEVTALESAEMIAQAEILKSYGEDVVIKLPLTIEGLKACNILSKKGYAINVTLCFSAMQALLAAKAGATYISPFIGRIDDIVQGAGMDIIEDIRLIYDNYGFETKILVASIRKLESICEAAKIGADVITAPPVVLKQLINHQLTDIGLKKFLDDWKNSKLNI